ncbi:MAG TPA: GNAT family N-acetyltransferase [Pyrinomonadaceae bacterium]|jgi:ribosomal-protein-alanine N-acetyltransferase
MLETEHLIIRKFTPADACELIALRSDPEVSKYLGGSRMQNAEAVERRMQFYIGCYAEYGFGMCAMIWKETDEMIGWSGLQPLEETGKTEVGYGMAKKFWRRGIGYECARAWLEFGFTKTGLEKIVAIAQPENTGSWRIMEKLGMHFEGIEEHYGLNCKLYSITKAEFLNLLQSNL